MAGLQVDPSIQGTCEGSPGDQSWFTYSNIQSTMKISGGGRRKRWKRQATSNKLQATSVKHRAAQGASDKRQASSNKQEGPSHERQAASS